MTPARLVATVGGLGLLRPAPGTWASAAAVPAAWALHGLGGFPLLLVVTLALIPAGVWAIARMTEGRPDHDPPEAVIDEVVGQWIALFPLSAGLWLAGADPWVFPWPGWLGAFAMFRLFDIWKPGPVGALDRRNTPWASMLDDALAGLLAALVVALAAAVAHGALL